MRSLRQWVEDFIWHISHFNNFSKVLPVCANGVIKNLNINYSAAIGNIYAHVAPVNRGLNWAHSMFKNRFWKYFRYAQMTSFIFETIIEFSAAIRNVYAQFVLMNRGFTSTNIMLIWMLLWHPLTYLFPRGTRVLVWCNVIEFNLIQCFFLILSFFLAILGSLMRVKTRNQRMVHILSIATGGK